MTFPEGCGMPDDSRRNVDGWAIRAHHLCADIVWIAQLNALWLAFTALGGVLLGAAGLLLLITAGGIVAITAFAPALVLFFSIGAWIPLNTALCLSFFAANDARVVPVVSAQRSPR